MDSIKIVTSLCCCLTVLLCTGFGARVETDLTSNSTDADSLGTQIIDPLTAWGFWTGAIGLAGTIQSVYWTHSSRKIAAEELAAAQVLFTNYKQEMQDGCALLAQIMQILREKHAIASATFVQNGDKMSDVCEDTIFDRFSANIRLSCDSLGDSAELLEKPCELASSAVSARGMCSVEPDKILMRLSIEIARLSGLMTGMGCPKDARTSFLALHESQTVSSNISEQTGDLAVMMNIAGLVFNLLGIGDNTYSVYDQVHAATNGYEIVRELAEGNMHRQESVFCESAKVFWFEIAKTLALDQATMEATFTKEGLQLPQHLLNPRRMSTAFPTDWFDEFDGDSPASGSEWVCRESEKCLVPSDSKVLQDQDGYSYPLDGASQCKTSSAFFRMCTGPTTLVPISCFDGTFGSGLVGRGKEGARNRWRLRFGMPYASGYERIKFDLENCVKPLSALRMAHLNLVDVQTKLPDICA